MAAPGGKMNFLVGFSFSQIKECDRSRVVSHIFRCQKDAKGISSEQ
jgi:hypothetical protein